MGYDQWHVEWFDDRRAMAAHKQLVARDFAVHIPLSTFDLSKVLPLTVSITYFSGLPSDGHHT